ncbi:MAG: DUF1015 domain-containing protein [Desulfosarcina sp.]|nr:DUF1015 domain-containing protein [Desulfobacterales bacterium]
MATVEPFRGIRYNPREIASLAEVVTPPYDVISDRQQAMYYERSPFNIIRVELGRTLPDDDEKENAHTRAHRHLQEWESREVLIRDPEPSYYLTATRYPTDGGTATRWGLIARVRLEPFSAQGHILPHEHTFPKIKLERLGLMRACGMNISPIFALFNDQTDLMARLQTSVRELPPVLEFEDKNGDAHRMWRLKAPGPNADIRAVFENRRLYIADGHHRYETCLAYRDELARTERHFDNRHPANGTLMYLSSLQDPGLQVLPTHRALPTVAANLRTDFIRRAKPYFDCRTMAIDGDNADAATRQLCDALEAIPAENGLGVVIRGDERLHLLRLKRGAAERIYPSGVALPLRQLNVTLLTEFVFPELLEMGSDKLDDAQSIHFRHNAANTVAEVRRGSYDMAFILKSTPVERVRTIAEAGLIMPRKTTYFAPKVITGLVMRALKPAV